MAKNPSRRSLSHRGSSIVDPISSGPASARLMERIIEMADDAVISIDDHERICTFNRGAERIFGYIQAEALGQPLANLLPARFRKLHSEHVQGFLISPETSRMMHQRGEIHALRKNGEEFPAEASISKADTEAGVILTVILRDVTERKAAEASLRRALEDKETLLREVHHRVKNNLQVICSLLNLQARTADSEFVRRAFEESQNRVQAMALIHDRLYRSLDLGAVDFSDYLPQLAATLLRSYQVSSARVELGVEVENVRLSVDNAAPCGLIVNELISNSLKYAFPGERTGKIWIRSVRLPDSSVRMTIGDDGVGLPPRVGFWSTRTLGLRLVRMLVRQLDGEIEIGGPPGVEYRIRFCPEAADAVAARWTPPAS